MATWCDNFLVDFQWSCDASGWCSSKPKYQREPSLIFAIQNHFLFTLFVFVVSLYFYLFSICQWKSRNLFEVLVGRWQKVTQPLFTLDLYSINVFPNLLSTLELFLSSKKRPITNFQSFTQGSKFKTPKKLQIIMFWTIFKIEICKGKCSGPEKNFQDAFKCKWCRLNIRRTPQSKVKNCNWFVYIFFLRVCFTREVRSSSYGMSDIVSRHLF